MGVLATSLLAPAQIAKTLAPYLKTSFASTPQIRFLGIQPSTSLLATRQNSCPQAFDFSTAPGSVQPTGLASGDASLRISTRSLPVTRTVRLSESISMLIQPTAPSGVVTRRQIS